MLTPSWAMVKTGPKKYMTFFFVPRTRQRPERCDDSREQSELRKGAGNCRGVEIGLGSSPFSASIFFFCSCWGSTRWSLLDPTRVSFGSMLNGRQADKDAYGRQCNAERMQSPTAKVGRQWRQGMWVVDARQKPS